MIEKTENKQKRGWGLPIFKKTVRGWNVATCKNHLGTREWTFNLVELVFGSFGPHKRQEIANAA